MFRREIYGKISIKLILKIYENSVNHLGALYENSVNHLGALCGCVWTEGKASGRRAGKWGIRD
jgi:hypothetical protein